MAINRGRRQRREELRSLLKRIMTLVFLGVAMLSVFYAYEFLKTTDKLAIRQIRIEGVNRIGKLEIKKVLRDLVGQNILQAPLENYRERLTMIARVKDAKLRVILPFTVGCKIVEREPTALIFTNRFMEVDDEGMVFNEDDVTPTLDLPILTGLTNDVLVEGRICNDSRLQKALKTLLLCKEFGGEFADDISEIRIDERGISIISLHRGCVVILGEDEFERRLNKFFLVKDTIDKNETTVKVIDLRFADQVVLRHSF